MAIALGIRHTQILFTLAYELLSKPVFKSLRPLTFLIIWLADYLLRFFQFRSQLSFCLGMDLAWWHVIWVLLLRELLFICRRLTIAVIIIITSPSSSPLATSEWRGIFRLFGLICCASDNHLLSSRRAELIIFTHLRCHLGLLLQVIC